MDKKVQVGIGRSDSDPFRVWLGIEYVGHGYATGPDERPSTYFMDSLEAKLLASVLIGLAEKAEFINLSEMQQQDVISDAEANEARARWQIIPGGKSVNQSLFNDDTPQGNTDSII